MNSEEQIRLLVDRVWSNKAPSKPPAPAPPPPPAPPSNDEDAVNAELAVIEQRASRVRQGFRREKPIPVETLASIKRARSMRDDDNDDDNDESEQPSSDALAMLPPPPPPPTAKAKQPRAPSSVARPKQPRAPRTRKPKASAAAAAAAVLADPLHGEREAAAVSSQVSDDFEMLPVAIKKEEPDNDDAMLNADVLRFKPVKAFNRTSAGNTQLTVISSGCANVHDMNTFFKQMVLYNARQRELNLHKDAVAIANAGAARSVSGGAPAPDDNIPMEGVSSSSTNNSHTQIKKEPGVDDAAAASVVPDHNGPILHSLLGSLLQKDSITQQTALNACATQLGGVPLHSDRTAKVEETYRRCYQLIEQNQADAYERSLRYACNVAGAQVLTVPEYDTNTLLEQCIEQFGTLPACGAGQACVAASQLDPHDPFTPLAERPPMKAWQDPQDFAHFLNTGYLRAGSESNPCVLCIIAMVARCVVNARARGEPLHLALFPFFVRKNCPGGFTASALLNYNGMPGNFPKFSVADWLPVTRTVKGFHYNSATHQTVAYTRDKLRGYDLRDYCKFVRHTSSDECVDSHERSVRSLEATLLSVQLADFSDVLTDEVMSANGVMRVLGDRTHQHFAVLTRLLTLLLKPFQQSLCAVRASNAYDDEAAAALLARFDTNTNGFSCNANLRVARHRSQYSILYTLAMRVSLAALLVEEPAFALANNQNLLRFQQVHQPLLEWFVVQLAASKYRRIGDDPFLLPHALSDAFVMAAARDTPAERERRALQMLAQRKSASVSPLFHMPQPNGDATTTTTTPVVVDDEVLACALQLLDVLPNDAALTPYLTAAQLRKVRYSATSVRFATSNELLTERYYQNPARSSLLYDTPHPSSPSHTVLNKERTQALDALRQAWLTLDDVLCDELAHTIQALERVAQERCANEPVKIHTWLTTTLTALCMNFVYWRPDFVDSVLLAVDKAPLSLVACSDDYVERRSACYFHLLALLVRVNVVSRLLSIEERAHSVEHRKYIQALQDINDPYIVSPPVQHRRSSTASVARAAAGDDATDDESFQASEADNSSDYTQQQQPNPAPPLDDTRRRVLAALGTNNTQTQKDMCNTLLETPAHCTLQQTLHGTLEITLPEGLLHHEPDKRPSRAALQQAIPRSRPMGTIHSPYREAAYRLACVLYSHLRMADAVESLGNTVALATDAWFLEVLEPGLLRIHSVEPDERFVCNEDNAVDINEQLQHIGLAHNDDDDDALDNGTTRANSTDAWVYKVRAMVPIACLIRDVSERFPITMEDPQYAHWTLSNALCSLLGLYRHAAEHHAPFQRALLLHRRLDPQAACSAGPARIQECAQWLLAHEGILLEMQRESVFYQISLCPSYQAMLDTVWQHFDYVHSMWTPGVLEYVRRQLGENVPMLDITQNVARIFFDERESRPQVFRRIRESFPRHTINILRRAETKRRVSAIIDQALHQCDDDAARMPMLPDNIMLNVLRYVRNTPPGSKTLQLQWFRDCGMSPRGVLCVYELNALYNARASRTAMVDMAKRMNRVDFSLCWLIMHVLHQHHSRIVFALPMHVAEQQALAVRERCALVPGSTVLPEAFYSVTVCQILGCQKVVSYSLPMFTHKTLGLREGSYNCVYKALVCQRKNGTRMQAPLNRRVRDDGAITVAVDYNHAQLALAAMTPEQIAEDPERYRQDVAAKNELLKRVKAAVKKHVRAEIRIAFATPCNAHVSERYSLLGGVLHSLRQKEKESHYYTTICPRCGVFTTYSSDRHESNGFSCGQCQFNNRLLVHAARCICCDATEFVRLPLLSGERAAQKAQEKKGINKKNKKARHDAEAAALADKDPDPDDEVNAAMQALVDRSLLQPQSANALTPAGDAPVAPNKNKTKRTHTAVVSRNANAAVKVIERDQVSFHRYRVYDDRPVIGTQKDIWVYVCRHCDVLDERVKYFGLTLNELLCLLKDASRGSDTPLPHESTILDDIVERRVLAVLGNNNNNNHKNTASSAPRAKAAARKPPGRRRAQPKSADAKAAKPRRRNNKTTVVKTEPEVTPTEQLAAAAAASTDEVYTEREVTAEDLWDNDDDDNSYSFQVDTTRHVVTDANVFGDSDDEALAEDFLPAHLCADLFKQ